MTTYLLTFETQRQRVGRKVVLAPSLKAALNLGRELTAAYGAQAVVARPVNARGR